MAGKALRDMLGESGISLQRAANGIDDSPVNTERERKSYSHEQTFASDETDETRIKRTLLRMADRLTEQMRHDGVLAGTVRLKLRNRQFDTFTRQMRLKQPTDQTNDIFQAAATLLASSWDHSALRLVGVAVTELLSQGGIQLDLFEHADQRQARLNRAVDEIRDRYGSDAITRASLARLADAKDPVESGHDR